MKLFLNFIEHKWMFVAKYVKWRIYTISHTEWFSSSNDEVRCKGQSYTEEEHLIQTSTKNPC